MKEKIEEVLRSAMIPKEQKKHLLESIWNIVGGEKEVDDCIDESEEAYWGVIIKTNNKGEKIIKFACHETLDESDPIKTIKIGEEAFIDLIQFMRGWKYE